MVNGILHGTYPDQRYANMALESLCKPRPKASYTWQLINPNGDIVKSGQTPVAKSSGIKIN